SPELVVLRTHADRWIRALVAHVEVPVRVTVGAGVGSDDDAMAVVVEPDGHHHLVLVPALAAERVHDHLVHSRALPDDVVVHRLHRLRVHPADLGDLLERWFVERFVRLSDARHARGNYPGPTMSGHGRASAHHLCGRPRRGTSRPLDLPTPATVPRPRAARRA